MTKTSLYDLRCDNLEPPSVIQNPKPLLSWKLRSEAKNVVQKAYHIQVASTHAKLTAGEADIWDSGRIESEASHLVAYAGVALKSRQILHWQVTIWDQNNASTTSDRAHWEMGLLDSADWSADWIKPAKQSISNDPLVLDWCEKVVYYPTSDGGYERERKLDEMAIEKHAERVQRVKAAESATWLRQFFEITKPVAKARLYAATLGYAELYLDGEKISDRVLDPAQTDYELRALYTTDNLDATLPVGKHELRIHLAEGWYGQSQGFFDPLFRYGEPLALAQLEIVYADGTTDCITTNAGWEAAPSQLAKANLYTGEVYDARLNESDLVWGPVSGPDAEQPLPKSLEAQTLPPTRKVDAISVCSILETKPGVYLVDLGINFAGWIAIKLQAPRGTVVDLKYAESITPGKELDWDTMGRRAVGAYQWDRYIAKGEGVETYESRFTYHGFQYVEITGLAQKPAPEDIVGYQVRTDFKRTGHFKCSDPFINKLHECILWTYEANFVGLPSDCPHREKCGWLDAYNTAEMVYYNWDIATSIGKYIIDIETSSDLLDGLPSNIAPGRRNGMFEAFDWGICTVLLPWYRYHFTGDLSLAEKHWDYMVRYLEHGEKIAPHGIISGALGDWCDQPATLELSFTRVDGSPFNSHPATTASMHYFFATKSMATLARALGKGEAVALDFEQRAERIRKAINTVFFHKRAMTFRSQTQNAMALIYGVVDPENRQAVADRLAEEVVHGNGGHFNVGAHGAGFLYHALSHFGHADVAWKMFKKESYPSYRYMFAQGATSIWENMSRWDPVKKTTSKSLSHPFQAGFDHWFYNAIGGVQIDPFTPGSRKLIFLPQTVGFLNSGEASIETPYGTARSSWSLEGEAFNWRIEIPANASATVVVPSSIQACQIEGTTDGFGPCTYYGVTHPQAIMLGSGAYVISGKFDARTLTASVKHKL